MPRPHTKSQLIAEAQKEAQALQQLLSDLNPVQMEQAGESGEWSVKDVLAHLYEWQQMFFRWYEAGLRGETPAVPAEGYKWNQLPALNQAIYERYRHRPLDEIVHAFWDSHTRTLALIESLSEETLVTPGLYPWMNKNALIAYLASNTGSHYHWARAEMRKALKSAAA
ncbi:MAG: ClbS/DfsB family four-helix bundle protein [Chloroflexota bacterium]